MNKADDFTLLDQDGKSFTLSENLVKKILLVFYPKDDSLVCTKQLCSYNNNFERFLEKGIQVVGISTDKITSHKSFHSKHNFKFPILSDEDKEVSKKYNALNFLGMSQRKLFLISEDGFIINQNSVNPLFYKGTDFILNNLIK